MEAEGRLQSVEVIARVGVASPQAPLLKRAHTFSSRVGGTGSKSRSVQARQLIGRNDDRRARLTRHNTRRRVPLFFVFYL